MSDRKNSEERNNLKFGVPLTLLLTSLFCLAISTRSIEILPQKFGMAVFGVFQEGVAAVGNFVSGFFNSISELQQLRKEYLALAQKMESAANAERENANLNEENNRLRSQLGMSEQIPYSRIVCRIIAKDPTNIYSEIIIDRGIKDGIRKNMPVVAFQDGQQGLVGRVVEASYSTSKIVPIMDRDIFVSARLKTGSRYEGLVNGLGAQNQKLIMKYVSKKATQDINFGDVVITSGYGTIYPPDIAIGRVSKILDLDYQTSLDLELEPVIDFNRLEYLFALKIPEKAVTSVEEQ